MANRDGLLTVIPETAVAYETYIELRDKYETLQQQFTFMQLEKQEYEKEIKKMRDQLRDLAEESVHQRSESREYELLTQPMLSTSLNMLSTALETADELREEALDKNIKYELMIDTLTVQKSDMQQQNEQFVETVETLRHNVYKTEQDYQTKIEHLSLQIDVLKEEYLDIFEKYDAKIQECEKLKKQHNAELKTQMELNTPNVVDEDDTLPAFVVPFLRSLSDNECYTISRQISNPKLHSMLSIYEDDDMSFSDSDNNEMRAISEANEERLDKDTKKFVVNMIDTVQKKDIEIQKKDHEIQKLRKRNKRLLHIDLPADTEDEKETETDALFIRQNSQKSQFSASMFSLAGENDRAYNKQIMELEMELQDMKEENITLNVNIERLTERCNDLKHEMKHEIKQKEVMLERYKKENIRLVQEQKEEYGIMESRMNDKINQIQELHLIINDLSVDSSPAPGCYTLPKWFFGNITKGKDKE